MFEKYYCDVLEYIFHNPCCTVIKIDKKLHLSRVIIGSTVIELLEAKLIRNDEINGKITDGLVIKDKGLAYLESKRIISLTKEVQRQKRSLRPRLSKRKLVLNTIKNAIVILTIIGKFAWKYFIMLSIAVIGAYLSIGDNFKDLIKWLKHIFHHV